VREGLGGFGLADSARHELGRLGLGEGEVADVVATADEPAVRAVVRRAAGDV
jgi:hypothetical protein